LAIDDVAFKVEVIMDVGVERGEFLDRPYSNERQVLGTPIRGLNILSYIAANC